MNKGRLWQVFTKIDWRDLRELEKSVRSPWFNQRDYVIKLFDYLRECREELKIEPDKNSAFRRIFPNEPSYRDERMRNAQSLLLKVIERYLKLKTLESDEAAGQLALAEAYRKLQLQKHYDQTLRSAEQIIEKENIRDADYYSNAYDLEFEKYQARSVRRQLKEVNLQAVSDKLDIAYLAQKLRQTCFSIAHRRVYSTANYDLGLLPPLLEIAAKEKYQFIPAISLYYHGYFALTQPNEEFHFKKFKEQLFAFGNEFPKDELRDLYLLATNYCIKRMNEDAPQFAAEALDLYKEALQQGVLLSDGVLSHITFSNIVTMSLVTEKYEFAENFIKQYKNQLSSKYRKPISDYNLARLKYERGQFEEALPLLQAEVYKDLLLNLTAKTLIAKIFFESSEYDVLFSHLDAMNQFIRRKKVMGYHQENFQNFISFLKRIIEIPDFKKAQRLQLKSDIENAKAIAERRWLLEQI